MIAYELPQLVCSKFERGFSNLRGGSLVRLLKLLCKLVLSAIQATALSHADDEGV